MSKDNVAVAATEEKQAVKFRDDLITHSSGFKIKAKTDAATGTITLPAEVVFESETAKSLGVTPESFTKHLQFQDLTNNSLTHMGSELAVDMFKANPELQTIVMKVPFHKNASYEGTFNRKGSSRNPGTGEVSTYVGAIGTGRINVTSTRTKAEWQGIKQNMRDLAEAAGLE